MIPNGATEMPNRQKAEVHLNGCVIKPLHRPPLKLSTSTSTVMYALT